MTRPFIVFVVTIRDDPYVDGGRPVRVFVEDADAWNFIAEQVALHATERWSNPHRRGGMTRDQLMSAEAQAFQVFGGAVSYPQTEPSPLEIRG
jgi:hypothetical protein